MRYKVIETSTPGELVEKVNEDIKAGWEPQGGVNIIRYEREDPHKHYVEFYYEYGQAMIHRKIS
jgi:hypothetical protein